MVRVNMNCFYPLILVVLLFSSCSRTYKVEGSSSVTSLDGKMLFLKMLHEGEWVTVDSAEVLHGLFSMRGPVDSARVVTLYMNDEPLMPLVLEDGNVERGSGRWYDIDATVRTAINMLENSPVVVQKSVAKEMAKIVVDKIKEDADEKDDDEN